MARKPPTTPPPLRVVSAETSGASLDPPAGLGPEGSRLWREVTRDYEFSDPASIEILRQAVCSVDLAEQCRRQVQADGVMLKISGQVKEHPAMKVELTARSLSARLLARLGLDLEPAHPGPGRPAGQRGG